MTKSHFFNFDQIKLQNIHELLSVKTSTVLIGKLRSIFDKYLNFLAADTILWQNNRDRLLALENTFLNFMANYTEFILSNVNEDNKVSVLVQVGYEIFHQSFAEKLTKKKSIEIMSDMLNRHTIDSPPFRIKVLDLEDVKLASEYLIWNFFSWYEFYFTVFAKKEVAIVKSYTIEFGRKLPASMDLGSGTTIENPNDIQALREMYLQKEKEYEITDEELEAIMRGESSLNQPPKKREELIKRKLEAEKKEKIERILKRELEAVNQEIQQKMEEIRNQNELVA